MNGEYETRLKAIDWYMLVVWKHDSATNDKRFIQRKLTEEISVIDVDVAGSGIGIIGNNNNKTSCCCELERKHTQSNGGKHISCVSKA